MESPNKITLSAVALLFICSTVKAQTIELDIEGLKIGAKNNAITKKLGKPRSSRRGGEVPCGDAMSTLRYNGLVLRLEVGGTVPLGLYKVEVTSSRWSVSGLRIGASRSNVIRKLGHGRTDNTSNGRHLGYFINDGYARLYFHKNRLTKVEWEFNFC